MMSMDLLELGNGMMMISGPTYMNRSCNIMMNNAVPAGCSFGVGHPLDYASSNLQQPYETVSKSPDGRGMGGGFFPFTNAQWKELERQAMVFKYMMHSIPVPYNLLYPFISSPSTTDPSGMVIRRDTHLLKFLKNGDPEPGRCRRTDGKKWRCANAVATDQKYCEKHLHRGRPRSRKHVEAASSTSSDLNKIHKKPCLSQAQNQSSICPQVSSPPQTGPFQLMSNTKPSHADLWRDEQWQHHQLSLDSYSQQSNLKKPATSVVIDAWSLSTEHDLVSLGLSMGHGTKTKQDETDGWLGESGGPLGEVLRRPPLTPSSSTTANNGAASSPLISCTEAVASPSDAVASLSDAASARHTS